nr:NAD-dependent protein deacylase [Anaerolineae bacterium]
AGTAGAVFPAAQLPWDAKEANKAIVIDINPEPTDYDAFADFSLRGAFGQVMPALVEAMRAGR